MQDHQVILKISVGALGMKVACLAKRITNPVPQLVIAMTKMETKVFKSWKVSGHNFPTMQQNTFTFQSVGAPMVRSGICNVCGCFRSDLRQHMESHSGQSFQVNLRLIILCYLV